MKRNIIILLLLAGGLSQLSAQDINRSQYWKRSGLTAVNLSQVSLSNWSAGGESTLGLDAMFNYNADYKKDRHLMQNRLELSYGLNRTESNGTRKTNDKIYMSSIYGYELKKNLYLSGLMSFQTQFAKGYDYAVSTDAFISKFMAPGYLTFGAGLTWTPKPWLTATLSPATWRGTFVTNQRLADIGSFGVKDGKHLLSEFGANLKVEAKYEVLKNMTVYTRVDLYSNYLHEPQNVDVSWDVLLNMKINSWFSANLTTNLVYDNDIKMVQKDGSSGPRVQFKEVLGVGFQVNF